MQIFLTIIWVFPCFSIAGNSIGKWWPLCCGFYSGKWTDNQRSGVTTLFNCNYLMFCQLKNRAFHPKDQYRLKFLRKFVKSKVVSLRFVRIKRRCDFNCKMSYQTRQIYFGRPIVERRVWLSLSDTTLRSVESPRWVAERRSAGVHVQRSLNGGEAAGAQLPNGQGTRCQPSNSQFGPNTEAKQWPLPTKCE